MPIDGLLAVRQFGLEPLVAPDGTQGILIVCHLLDGSEPIQLAVTLENAMWLAGALPRAVELQSQPEPKGPKPN